MKVISPRHSFSLDYTPKQWVVFCNTILLILVTFMCGMVVYEICDINQKFVTILDSSAIAIDILATNIINSKTTPFWKTINNDVSVYSAYYKATSFDEGLIIIIGSSTKSGVDFKDIRCLIKYADTEDISIMEASYEKFSNCNTLFLRCPSKSDGVPTKVVLISNEDIISKRWIDIEIISRKTDGDIIAPKIAACVQPLDESVSVKQIQEFVTFYEIVGLSHFYFYNNNATQSTVDFIQQLIYNDYPISILPWNKKLESSEKCPALGYEYVQDCLHQALNKYSDVLTVNTADYFVPLKYFSIDKMLLNFNNSYEVLHINKANYCDIHDQKEVVQQSIRKMLFRGPICPSKTNYFLRPEFKAAIEFHGASASASKKIGKFVQDLPENEGIVQHLVRKCDSDVTLDSSAYKYFKKIDKSMIFEAYKQTSRKTVVQIPFPFV
ncbi:glycosyltransferase family 92 protein [Caerostris extrusa]|uniref:Glycosyltransferase family 92 protein n=1 Tax=Caerostris extrusa TaxID=172846 RepID=A0AAV4XP56_CAEEX|nr:glycosyltransferase family 92 protein [Caerostris extrusa]